MSMPHRNVVPIDQCRFVWVCVYVREVWHRDGVTIYQCRFPVPAWVFIFNFILFLFLFFSWFGSLRFHKVFLMPCMAQFD